MSYDMEQVWVCKDGVCGNFTCLRCTTSQRGKAREDSLKASLSAARLERDAAVERATELALSESAAVARQIAADSEAQSNLQRADAAEARAERAERRAEEAEARERRWYRSDGTFEELPAEMVIIRRKAAAADLERLALAEKVAAAATGYQRATDNAMACPPSNECHSDCWERVDVRGDALRAALTAWGEGKGSRCRCGSPTSVVCDSTLQYVDRCQNAPSAPPPRAPEDAP